jgi:hypothetical protein
VMLIHWSRWSGHSPKRGFKSVREAGDWHIKVIEGSNQCRNANRKRAGRPRMSKEEFKSRMMEDLKHE